MQDLFVIRPIIAIGRSVYLRAKARHIILTGHLECHSVAAFLQELLHEAHFPRNRGLRAVLLSPLELTTDMKAILESSTFVDHVDYLQGSPLVESDLQRACSERASAVFILSDKRHSERNKQALQDEYACMYMVSIQASCPTVPIFVQTVGTLQLNQVGPLQ